jgi:mono/diheme cytochrome c family protein
VGLGAATLALAVLAFIVWLTYVLTRGPAKPRRESAPPNLEPYLTDDDLESKRLNRVLVAALAASGLLAILMPIYYLGETSRQARAEHMFEDIAIERGHEWFIEFQCVDCHGPRGGGGSSSFLEPRSGILTSWMAPSLDDIFHRYEPEQIRHWVTFGRAGTPMPAWGVEGGGPLSEQQVDEIVAYIREIQISQEAAFAAVEDRVRAELTRIDSADDVVDGRIEAQRAAIADLLAAPDQYAAVEAVPKELERILTEDGTCTARSAALYGTTCTAPGADSDRDGLSDAAENLVNDLIERLLAVVPPSDAAADLARLSLDPTSPISSTDPQGRPLPDIEAADDVIADVTNVVRSLRLTTENLDTLLASAERGLEFLIEARAARRYAFDFDTIAAEAFDGDLDDARRAVGLYNAYCARCHTAGYPAGVAFTREAGSGGFGPGLLGGRSVVQFPDPQDHLDFIIAGSQPAVPYGLSGIGRGWMPGFGTVLSEYDLMLIVTFERGLP